MHGPVVKVFNISVVEDNKGIVSFSSEELLWLPEEEEETFESLEKPCDAM
jgi:hypothetical protein